jgi:DNA-binding transcriptional ArsR family regulator
MERVVRQRKNANDPNEINIRQAAELMRSLGNPNRLMIACALLHGEKSVSELESTLGIKQPILSQQLADLRESGVLRARRSSKSVFYSLAEAKAEHLISSLQRIFCENPTFDEPPSAKVPQPVKATLQAAVFARVGRHSYGR